MRALALAALVQSALCSVPQSYRHSVHQRLAALAHASLVATSSVLFSSAASAKVRGYNAASSAFAPSQFTSVIPRLAQSVLLNTLPIENELVGELQAYLESFNQLIDPSNRQINQLNQPDSILWNNLRVNAQRAAGMFLYNRDGLLPQIAPDDTFVQQSKRRNYGELYLAGLKENVLKLVAASIKSDVAESIRLMKLSLTYLADVAYLLVPEDILYRNATDSSIETQYASTPRLIGRATVELTFQRPGPLSILKNDEKNDKAKVVMIVDGINYPYASGSFINLCLSRYYESTRVEVDNYEYNGVTVPRYLFGDVSGYRDPLSGELRTVPLEVLRGSKGKRAATVTGNAFNTLVFTRDKPVKSFATEGTIGMYHPRGDGNGGSSALFWVPPDRTNISPTLKSEQPALARLNTRFAAFAHVVDGVEVLTKLRPSDVIVSAEVLEGAWELSNYDDSGIIPSDRLKAKKPVAII